MQRARHVAWLGLEIARCAGYNGSMSKRRKHPLARQVPNSIDSMSNTFDKLSVAVTLQQRAALQLAWSYVPKDVRLLLRAGRRPGRHASRLVAALAAADEVLAPRTPRP